MGALDIVIGRRQHSAEGRPHAQHLEIISGHQFARATVGLSVARNGGGKLIARHHAVKNSRVFCQPLVQWVGKNLRIVAIAPDMPMFRSGRLQHHQLARIPHRQPPQQHLIEQGEDRRVCTDAQRERHNGNEAKTRIFREHSQAVPHVLEEHGHLQSSAGARRDFLAGAEIGNPQFRSALEGRHTVTSGGSGRSCPRRTCRRGSPCPRPSIHPGARLCSPSFAPT